MRFSLIVFALILSGFGCASGQTKKPLTPKEKAAQLVSIADGAVVEGDPTGALQFLSEAETLDPKLPALHHVRALALFQRKELSAAIRSAQEAVRLKPDYAEANNTLGRLFIEAGQLENSIAPLQKAAQNLVFRESYKADINLGIAFYKMGKLGQAERSFDHAIAIAPLQACIAYYYRGHIEMRAGKVQDAISSYEKATQRFCARFSDAHLALGVAYARDQQLDRARKKFLDIYKIFPDTKVAKQAMDELKKIP
jgi:Tfp pilus assembly protein PilF